MLIIGESLNGTSPSVAKAIINRDESWIKELAQRQIDCGAHVLDVNAGGLSGRDESVDLTWMVEIVQATVHVPLVLDSTNPDALRAAINVYRGPRPILSSISGEPKRLESVLSIAVEHDCKLVALCVGERGIPASPEDRVAVAKALIDRAASVGIKTNDLYIDPLVMTISVDHNAGNVCLNTLRLLREQFPDVGTICGMSNVSFGMPLRPLINRTMAAMLMAYGLEAFMVDVRNAELMASIYAAAALAGRDARCRGYMKAFRAGKLGS